MTRYITEIAGARREPEELQVLHSYPKTAPHQGEDQMAQRIAWPPSRAELDEMTTRTEKVMADPGTSLLDRLRAVEREQLVHNQYLKQPGADAELQAEAQREMEAGG
jgi:hypothetical protein